MGKEIVKLAIALVLLGWGSTSPLNGYSIPHLIALGVGVVLGAKQIVKIYNWR